jgi:hypothetical protein
MIPNSVDIKMKDGTQWYFTGLMYRHEFFDIISKRWRKITNQVLNTFMQSKLIIH